MPDARQLLEPFAETRDRQTSCIIKVETAAVGADNPSRTRICKGYGKAELRWDGRRTSVRSWMWGEWGSGTPIIPESKPLYESYLWDGNDFYQYRRATHISDNPLPSGQLTLARGWKRPSEIAVASRCVVTKLWGCMDKDVNRVDAILKEAKHLSVRTQMEKVGGASCYVLDGDTVRGKYTVWIDPAHGHNIAKVRVERRPGDAVYAPVLNYRLKEKERIDEVVENKRFEQIDGAWAPVEGEYQVEQDWGAGLYNWGAIDIKVTSVKLNPDHERPGSFKPDDIPNGAASSVDGMSGRYEWLDGKVVEAGSLASVPVVGKSLPDAAERPSSQELLDKSAAAHDRLKSFVIQYEDSTTYLDGPSTFTSYSAGEMRFDGRHVADRSRVWGRLNPRLELSKEKPGYRSRLEDGQFLYSYERGRSSDTEAGTLSLHDAVAIKAALPDIARSPLELRLSVGREWKRVDERLREASVVRVRDKLEPAGAEASPCYVLEADTRHGRYIVWLDPAHGYLPAKAVRDCRFGHLRPNDQPYGQRETILGTLDKVRFERRGDIWVPMEFTNSIDETDAMGQRSRQTNLFRVTRITLNPDHVALKSFVPDDVEEGAVVTDGHGQKIGVWHAGRVLDAKGNVVRTLESSVGVKNGKTP
jgi:hypothetical protein